MARPIFNIYEAKTGLSRLITRAEEGEEVIIARSGTALVKLVPVTGPGALRPVGLDAGEVDEAFLAESMRPLQEDELTDFYGPGL